MFVLAPSPFSQIRVPVPNPGDLLQHTLSKAKYWYVGNIPGKPLAVIVQNVDYDAEMYTIGFHSLNQYYDVVANNNMQPGKKYISNTTNSTMIVEQLFTSPDGKSTVAFGWYTRAGSTVHQACFVEDRNFDRWEEVQA